MPVGGWGLLFCQFYFALKHDQNALLAVFARFSSNAPANLSTSESAGMAFFVA